MGMMTVTEIKHAIAELPTRKRRALARWFADQESAAWDEEMDHDAAAGCLQFLVDEAEAEEKAGKLRKFA